MAKKEFVPINLTGGMQESTSEQLRTKLVRMENCWYVKTGVIAPRPGYTRPVTNPSTAALSVTNGVTSRLTNLTYNQTQSRPSQIAAFNSSSITIWRDILSDYISANGTRVVKDQVSEATSEIKTVASMSQGLDDASSANFTISGKSISLIMYRDCSYLYSGYLRFSIVDNTNGSTVIANQLVSASYSYACGAPIVLPWTSTSAIVLFSNGSTIDYFTVDLTTISAPSFSTPGVSIGSPDFGQIDTNTASVVAPRLVAAKYRSISSSPVVVFAYVDTTGQLYVGKITSGPTVTTAVALTATLGVRTSTAFPVSIDVCFDSDTVVGVVLSYKITNNSRLRFAEVTLSSLALVNSWEITSVTDNSSQTGYALERISLCSVGTDGDRKYLIGGNTNLYQGGGTSTSVTSDYGGCFKWFYLSISVFDIPTWSRWRANGIYELYSQFLKKTDTAYDGSSYTRYYALLGGPGCVFSVTDETTKLPALYLVEIPGVGTTADSTTTDNWSNIRIVTTALFPGAFNGAFYNQAGAALGYRENNYAKPLQTLTEITTASVATEKDSGVVVYGVISNSSKLLEPGGAINRLKFDFYKQRQVIPFNNGAFLTGGSPEFYDGSIVSEVGSPMVYPIPNITSSTGSGGSSITYRYKYIMEYVDAIGNSSPMGISVTTTSGTATTGVTNNVQIQTLSHTKSQDWHNNYFGCIRIKLYREYGGVYRLVTSTPNIVSSRSITIADSLSTDLSAAERLYTLGADGLETSGPLPNYNPPSCKFACAYKNKLWLSGTPTGEIWYSKPQVSFELPQFSPSLIIEPFSGGDVVGMANQETYLVIFKNSSVWYVSGDGLDETGTSGGISPPVNISNDIGCSEPRSIIATAAGVYFLSNNDIYLLEKNTFALKYVGFDVSDQTSLDGYECISAISVAQGNELRFCFKSSTDTFVLFYDTRYNTWSKWFYNQTVANNVCSMAETYGDGVATLFYEAGGEAIEGGLTDAVTTSTTTSVDADIETSWFDINGKLGYGRISRIGFLGEIGGTYSVEYLKEYTDYNPGAIKTSASTSGSTQPFKVEYLCSNQRCTSMKLRFRWSNSSGTGLRITGAGLLANVIGGKDRVRPSRRIGGT